MPWDLQDPKGHIRGQQWETNGLEAGKGAEQGRAMPPLWGEHSAEEWRIAGGKTSSQVIPQFQDRTVVVLKERAVTVEDIRLRDGLNRRVREKKAFGTVPRI